MSDILIINFDSLEEKGFLYGALRKLRGVFKIEITTVRNTRSNQQNRLYHGVYVQAFVSYLRSHRNEMSAGTVHRILARKFLTVEALDPNTGEVIGEYVRSTKDLSTTEFTEFLDKIRKYFAEEFHIEIPSQFEEVRRDN